MFLSEWRELPSTPCLRGEEKKLMTARVSMLLKSRMSLTSFRACFLPGRAKNLSASMYITFRTTLHPDNVHRIAFQNTESNITFRNSNMFSPSGLKSTWSWSTFSVRPVKKSDSLFPVRLWFSQGIS